MGCTWRVQSATRHAGEAAGQVSRGVQGVWVAGRHVWVARHISMQGWVDVPGGLMVTWPGYVLVVWAHGWKLWDMWCGGSSRTDGRVYRE